MQLLKWASAELKGESPLKYIGRLHAANIEAGLKQNKPEIALQEDVAALREILERLREERRAFHSRREVGLLLEMSPERQIFNAWLETIPDKRFKRFATSMVAKGEHYG